MPTALRLDGQASFPDDMVGATIVQIGTPVDPGLIEGGGMVIDYCPMSSPTVRRLVLGFTELGAWVEYLGFAEVPPTLAAPE